MAQPLNRFLYNRLQQIFGTVKITAQGQAMACPLVVEGRDGKKEVEYMQRGEQYSVCCPYCSDTRYRLSIHHMYGKEDPKTGRIRYPANCYNEECLRKTENWQDLRDNIETRQGELKKAYVTVGCILPEEDRTVEMPGPFKLLNELPDTHKAVAYVESRQFDADFLSKAYQVSYCIDSRFTLARNRIVIPVYENQELRGWQCRYIGELPWKDKEKRKSLNLPPKYFTCPSSNFRSHCIYNWDRMKNWHTGVIVEGPTDVWRFGFMAGCLFGNTMTPRQRQKYKAVFNKPDRATVLLIDPDQKGEDHVQKLISWFHTWSRDNFVAVWLPKNTDPGSMDKDWLRDYVQTKAKKKGVRVKFKKVA